MSVAEDCVASRRELGGSLTQSPAKLLQFLTLRLGHRNAAGVSAGRRSAANVGHRVIECPRRGLAPSN